MNIDQALELAQSYGEKGQLNQAFDIVQKIIAVQPQHPEANYLYGIILAQRGNLMGALKHIQLAARIRPKNSLIQYNLGTLYQQLNRWQEAETTLTQAVTNDPNYIEAWYNLGMVQQQLQQYDKAINIYKKVINKAPQFARAHNQLAATLTAMGRASNAVEHHKKALSLAPDDGEIHLDYAICLTHQKQFAQAIEHFQQAISYQAPLVETYFHLTRVQLMAKRYSDALESCQAWLKYEPTDCNALSNKLFALMGLNKQQQFLPMIDYSSCLRTYPLTETMIKKSAPQQTLANYNQQLTQFILQHKDLRAATSNRATRHGRHLENLFSTPDTVFNSLIQHIKQSIDHYYTATQEVQYQPLTKPKQYTLSAWSVVMSSQGHQTPHIHPDGVLSGVYYVQLPKTIKQQENDQSGCIEFGRAPEDYQLEQPTESLQLITPKEGLMLLFPSYYHHRTIPFNSDETRISIAFDVIAKN